MGYRSSSGTSEKILGMFKIVLVLQRGELLRKESIFLYKNICPVFLFKINALLFV